MSSTNPKRHNVRNVCHVSRKKNIIKIKLFLSFSMWTFTNELIFKRNLCFIFFKFRNLNLHILFNCHKYKIWTAVRIQFMKVEPHYCQIKYHKFHFKIIPFYTYILYIFIATTKVSENWKRTCLTWTTNRDVIKEYWRWLKEDIKCYMLCRDYLCTWMLTFNTF